MGPRPGCASQVRETAAPGAGARLAIGREHEAQQAPVRPLDASALAGVAGGLKSGLTFTVDCYTANCMTLGTLCPTHDCMLTFTSCAC